MTVTCPSCHTKFSVNESLFKTAQQKMRCSKCGAQFVYTVEETSANDTASEQTPLQQTFAEIAARVAAQSTQDRETIPGEQPAEQRPRRGVKAAIIALVILILLCAGGYFYWMNYMGAGDRWLRIGRLEGQEVVVQDGKVFLVTGVVSNGSTKGRKSIILRVKLFDRQGKIIMAKDAMAGMLLSKQQIIALQRGDIERRVAAFKLSPAETFRVEAGKEIPFSVSFLDQDLGKAKEFTVEVVQSSSL